MLILVIVAALVAGSAVTVLAEEADGLAAFRRSRSRCSHCGRTLGVRDLFPLVSFLVLRGRCRHCGTPIPRWHLGAELAVLVLFLAAFLQGFHGVSFVFLGVMLALLVALTITDVRFWTLPDPLVALLALAGVLRSLVAPPPLPGAAVLGGGVGVMLLGALALATRGRAMGWGDVKLAGAMGLALGWSALLAALAVAFLAGGIVGALLLSTKRATMKSHVPFGPFLAGATLLLLLVPGLPQWVQVFLHLQ